MIAQESQYVDMEKMRKRLLKALVNAFAEATRRDPHEIHPELFPEQKEANPKN